METGIFYFLICLSAGFFIGWIWEMKRNLDNEKAYRLLKREFNELWDRNEALLEKMDLLFGEKKAQGW